LAKEIIRGLQAYITTGFETSTPWFAGAFKELVEAPGRFYKGPYLSISLPFKPGNVERDFFSTLETDFPPYRHQQQAWQRLGSERESRSTLIATGTGSGKTECFLYPLLDHCMRHPGPGVKAIVVYPMNALATDQAKRFAKAVHGASGPRGKVRVGLFVGGLEEQPSQSMGPATVITDKNQLRDEPPDILLTNYKMLDFLLLRPRDQKLWQFNGSGVLRYLVVDELHTFDGAQGTDLACLIRRLKARLLPRDAAGLICVGTSATLGSSDEREALIRYAGQVFQSPFDSNSIIGETRLSAGEYLNEPIEYLFTPTQGMAESLDPAAYASPVDYLKAQYPLFFPGQREARPESPQWCMALGKQLKRHLLFNNLLRILARQPLPLNEISAELARTLPTGESRRSAEALLDSLCALIAIARDEQAQPLVNLRLQLWMRELRRMVAPLRSDPTQVDGGFRLEFSDDLKANNSALYLPIVQCNHCNTTAWLTRRPQSGTQIQTDLRAIFNDFFRHDPQSQVVLPLQADEQAPASEGRLQWLCVHCGQLQQEGEQCLACGEGELQRVFLPNLVRERQVAGVPRLVSERNCPVCEKPDALLVFGARSASLSSVAIHHVYATPFNDDKKLIAFSDSVQDAAHRAGFFAARTWQNNIRMAIARALPPQGMGLVDFWRHLPRYWLEKRLNPNAMDRARFVVEFIAPNMQYYQDYERLVATEELQEGSDLISQVSKRLVWEVLAEFGYRASIGRSLEQTGVAALGVDPSRVNDAVEKLLMPLRELEGLNGISETGLRHFLLGLLLHLKQSGAIYHRFLDSYIENGGKSYILHRTPFLPDFFRQSHAPIFLTDAPSHAHFDCLIASKGRSWYQHWLRKTLGAEQLVMPAQADSAIYSRVLKMLVEVELLLPIEWRGQTVWGLNPETLTLSPDVVVFETRHARDRLHVPRVLAEWVKGLPSLAANDQGHYQVSDHQPSWLAHIYRKGEIKRVIAKEHTGLLQREQRQEIERDFMDGCKPWQPNLLSATPTLEMGIDIGDLSSLLLCSVPPAQANYLQRIGRAGRRDGNAFSLT
ncbi:MAG: DEAD/DEAH box helicase, partial [Pseudomonadota bacterium]